jgi:hypothetical protein
MCDLAFPQRVGWFLRFYEDSRQWSEMPPRFRNWIEHEQRAVNLRIWQPSSLSGLVQTEAYALAQLRTFPGATAEQVTNGSQPESGGNSSSLVKRPPRRWCGS